MNSVGLVLGGGGVTGAAFHLGTLLAIQMATGWDPDDSEVVVGTSAGAFVSALVRSNSLTLDSFAGPGESREEIHDWLSGYLLRRGTPRGAVRWIRRGLLPALRRPGLHIALASPGLYRTDGITEWVEKVCPEMAQSWPEKPTAIVAYDVEHRGRAPFGTEGTPETALSHAVAASSAVPFVYEPVRIHDRWYADGGLASGTHADLLLASPEPLDLVLIVAPLAATEPRKGGAIYEEVFDRVGRTALASEVARIKEEWPDTDVLVLRPDEAVLKAARPNMMSVEATIPTFLTTLRSMRSELARASVWAMLTRHLEIPMASPRSASP